MNQALDFLDPSQVVSRYYDDCARLVVEFTGARAFGAGQEKSGQRIKGGQQVQGPAQIVRGDYMLTAR